MAINISTSIILDANNEDKLRESNEQKREEILYT